MAWLWIVLALILAIGPIAYLVPSRRDRRLAKLRMQARLEGGLVELENLPKLNAQAHERVSAGGIARDPKQPCARYLLAGGKALRDTPELQVLKHPDGSWQRDPAVGRPVAATWLALLESAAEGLPSDTLAIALRDRHVSVCWLESHPADEATVTALYGALRALRDAACELAKPLEEDEMP